MSGWNGNHFYEGTPQSGVARDAKQTASHASRDAARAVQDTEELGRRLDRMALMTEALWTILRDRLDLTDDELAQVAYDIDMADGKLDGRAERTASACTRCKRMVSPRHVKCIYCGTPMQRTPFTGT